MAEPIVAVAQGAFANLELLAKTFRTQADIRSADLSTAESTRASTDTASVVVVTLQRLDKSIIDAFSPTVRVIGRAGVGLDTIDLEAAKRAGVAVINQPAYGAAEVATHALGLLLALHRRLLDSDRFVRGGWSGQLDLTGIQPLDQARVGVLGSGRIGRATIDRMLPVVRSIAVYDPFVAQPHPAAQVVSSLGELLRVSDVLTLHLPLNEQTRNLIGRAELGQLPRGAIVINVARGGLIDESALVELLRTGHLAGAGLDVFDQEPLPPDAAILSAPRTILTPHSASVSERSTQRLWQWTLGDTLAWIAGQPVTHGALAVDPAAETPDVRVPTSPSLSTETLS